MRFLPAIVAIFFIICFLGCGRSTGDNRFIGKWTFDRDYTVAYIPKELLQPSDATPAPTATPKGSPNEAAAMPKEVNTMMDQTLKPMLVQQLLGQLDGQTFSFTPKTMTSSEGKTLTYEVIERADPDSMTVKYSDGDVQVYSIEDGRIVLPTTGSVHFKTYYKRVSQ